ncbi:MAG: hypothetical protein LBL93_00045 [Ruminococcus sp.]|jgi:hypothetical protein|nr:hypothetical protein [Ruminococcus sp.]
MKIKLSLFIAQIFTLTIVLAGCSVTDNIKTDIPNGEEDLANMFVQSVLSVKSDGEGTSVVTDKIVTGITEGQDARISDNVTSVPGTGSAPVNPNNKNLKSPVSGRSHTWKEVYRYIALDAKNETGADMFNVYDLNADGFAELVISSGAYHASKAKIYTYHDGKLADLGSFGSFGDFGFDSELNLIDSGIMTDGKITGEYYEIKNGKAEKVGEYFDNSVAALLSDDNIAEEVKNDKPDFVWSDFSARAYEITESNLNTVLSNFA